MGGSFVPQTQSNSFDYACVLRAASLPEAQVLPTQATAGKGGSRAVYIAPKEELAKERFADWTHKFGAPGLGLNVCMLTGDPLADYAMLREANIVVSTPEHWDMLSRRWRQPSRKEVRNVALFIVDELHLIGGANGPVLEVGWLHVMSSPTMSFDALSSR